MSNTMQRLSIFGSMIFLILAAALFLQMDWATSLPLWEEGRLTNMFYASIAASIACPILWVAYTREVAAATPGAINLAVSSLGITIFLFQSYTRSDSDRQLLMYTIIFAVFVVVNIGILVWSLRFSIQDARPMPLLVKFSFGLFTFVLIGVGGALVLKTENIFPWPFANEETSVFVGWIFLGAAVYFIYALIRPGWYNASGQLVGFLAYDLVLLVPFLLHFADVRSDLRDSLIIYTAVIIYSGVISAYFLFVNKATRIFKPI